MENFDWFQPRDKLNLQVVPEDHTIEFASNGKGHNVSSHLVLQIAGWSQPSLLVFGMFYSVRCMTCHQISLCKSIKTGVFCARAGSGSA